MNIRTFLVELFALTLLLCVLYVGIGIFGGAYLDPSVNTNVVACGPSKRC